MSLSKPTKAEILTARCKVFNHRFDGHVFAETVKQVPRWVGHFECDNCGTRRTDRMMPKSYELVSRDYDYSDAPNYDPSMTKEYARKILYKHMFAVAEEAA